MKTKIISLFTCMLGLSLLVTSWSQAQQQKYKNPAGSSPQQMVDLPANGNYSYRLFDASKNSWGYDIFNNGKAVFHQPSLQFTANNGKVFFVRREQAEKIALLSIAKIKRGISPTITNPELIAITR